MCKSLISKKNQTYSVKVGVKTLDGTFGTVEYELKW